MAILQENIRLFVTETFQYTHYPSPSMLIIHTSKMWPTAILLITGIESTGPQTVKLQLPARSMNSPRVQIYITDPPPKCSWKCTQKF